VATRFAGMVREPRSIGDTAGALSSNFRIENWYRRCAFFGWEYHDVRRATALLDED
jgi:hypothetical protein